MFYDDRAERRTRQFNQVYDKLEVCDLCMDETTFRYETTIDSRLIIKRCLTCGHVSVVRQKVIKKNADF